MPSRVRDSHSSIEEAIFRGAHMSISQMT
jgi:hypothetical protein